MFRSRPAPSSSLARASLSKILARRMNSWAIIAYRDEIDIPNGLSYEQRLSNTNEVQHLYNNTHNTQAANVGTIHDWCGAATRRQQQQQHCQDKVKVATAASASLPKGHLQRRCVRFGIFRLRLPDVYLLFELPAVRVGSQPPRVNVREEIPSLFTATDACSRTRRDVSILAPPPLFFGHTPPCSES